MQRRVLTVAAILTMLVLSIALRTSTSVDGVARADESNQQALVTHIDGLLDQLNDDRFVHRNQALEQLRNLAREPLVQPTLSRVIQQALMREETSFEVRHQLKSLAESLPPPDAVEPPGSEDSVQASEVERLISLLDADDYGARLGAANRLNWLLADRRHVVPAMVALKERLAGVELSADTRTRVEQLWHEARAAWLLGDPAEDQLPPVTDTQMNRWVATLIEPFSASARQRGRLARNQAERELGDLLAREPYFPQVAPKLERALANERLDADAIERLERLTSWLKHGLVAEYWEAIPEIVQTSDDQAEARAVLKWTRKQMGAQYLIVGEPSWGPGAERPSFFDRANDQIAHCASGNSLEFPRDYPVQRGIPHPHKRTALFHLVNLPTPRRRMAYDYLLKRNEQERLTALSQRSCDDWLQQRKTLNGDEVSMLRVFDPAVVSDFAGKYFLAVEDGPLDGDLDRPLHAAICNGLYEYGTRAAVPPLLAALERERFLPPTRRMPYDYPWLAAWAIAQRDPWPEADRWLQGQLDSTTPLVLGGSKSPERGATAAALLLTRHGASPEDYGLERMEFEGIDLRLGGMRFINPTPADGAPKIEAYRFTAPEHRDEVRKWWVHRQRELQILEAARRGT